MANRMKTPFNNIISPIQGAFLVNMHIGDNVGVSHELIHKINNLNPKSKGWFAIKMDMCNAYDRI